MQNIETSCDLIMNSVRSSQLNFACQETPFSIYITITKSQHRKAVGLEHAVGKNLAIAVLQEENLLLKQTIADLETMLKDSDDKVKQAEIKLDAVDTKQRKEVLQWKEGFTKKDSEISSLKLVLKNKDSEILKMKSENSQLRKLAKSREKEIHNLENIQANQKDTIRNLKEINNKMKSEKVKLDKEVKKLDKKIETIQDRSSQQSEPNNNVDIKLFPKLSPSTTLFSACSAPTSEASLQKPLMGTVTTPTLSPPWQSTSPSSSTANASSNTVDTALS